ncbi:MAG: type II toxin-antitoxin system prevent-host-death family antitoxin [Dehalococcoidia bacterium]|nr:type II toxin-antitoxin system prevent-host-death family antitoxin [Dehalococcoidia bacterium]
MKTVTSNAAKTHLAQLLDEVEQGETVTIARHGVPVAELRPPEPPVSHPRFTPSEAVAALRAFRDAHPLGDGMTVQQLMDESRYGTPPDDNGSADAQAAMEEWREIRKGIRLDGLSTRELIDEGRLGSETPSPGDHANDHR